MISAAQKPIPAGEAADPSLPGWAETLRAKYLAGEATVFVLHRNVFDHVLVDAAKPGGRDYPLVDFLAEVLFARRRRRVLELTIARGVRALGDTDASFRDRLFAEVKGKPLSEVLETLESRMRSPDATALIVPYAATIAPAADIATMGVEDRIALTTLHRWSLDPAITRSDNIIVLIAESLAELHPSILASPKVAAVEIPMPDAVERRHAIDLYAPDTPDDVAQRLAEHTAGLRLLQLAAIVSNDEKGLTTHERTSLIEALLAGTPDATLRAQKMAAITAGMTREEITQLVDPTRKVADGADPYSEMLDIVRKRKRELIEKECAGLIEFVNPSYGLDAVGGNESLKSELMHIAHAIRSGDRARSPMGLLAVGPMGAGKTFVLKAFLKEAGLAGVALKNFRSKWVGSTEGNLDRVLTTIRAMGPIALFIDEGDRSFGRGSEDSDSGTSSRVIARLKEFMSDPDNRGVVLFVLLTNRPDRLDIDIKRPGRTDAKLPFFYAETGEERIAVMRAVLRRYAPQAAVDWNDAALATAVHKLERYSNADLEALVLLAVDIAFRRQAALDGAAVLAAIGDFMPPQQVHMIDYMEMLAVAETSRRSLLPARFRDMRPADVQEKLERMRRAVGE